MGFTACGKIVALVTNVSVSVAFKIINEEIEESIQHTRIWKERLQIQSSVVL